jgi:hypothetical protein
MIGVERHEVVGEGQLRGMPLALIKPVRSADRPGEPVDIEKCSRTLGQEVIEFAIEELNPSPLSAAHADLLAAEKRAGWTRNVLHVERRPSVLPQAAADAGHVGECRRHVPRFVVTQARAEAGQAAMVEGHENPVGLGSRDYRIDRDGLV